MKIVPVNILKYSNCSPFHQRNNPSLGLLSPILRKGVSELQWVPNLHPIQNDLREFEEYLPVRVTKIQLIIFLWHYWQLKTITSSKQYRAFTEKTLHKGNNLWIIHPPDFQVAMRSTFFLLFTQLRSSFLKRYPKSKIFSPAYLNFW